MKRTLLAALTVGLITFAASAQDLSDKSSEKLVTMLENDTSEIAALQELGNRGDVTVKAMKEYAKPYAEDKWTETITGDMLTYFNSVNWWEYSGGDMEKIANACKELVALFPAPSNQKLGTLISAIRDKQKAMQDDW